MPESSYPNFAGKHAGEALFTASDFLAYLRRVGARDDTPAPDGVVLCYQRSLYDHVLRTEGVERSRRALPVALPSTGGRVGLLGRFGIGAPAARRRWRNWPPWVPRPWCPSARRAACSAT